MIVKKEGMKMVRAVMPKNDHIEKIVAEKEDFKQALHEQVHHHGTSSNLSKNNLGRCEIFTLSEGAPRKKEGQAHLNT